MKSKVIRFCEKCILFALHGVIIGLGVTVILAMGFAIYQSLGGS